MKISRLPILEVMATPGMYANGFETHIEKHEFSSFADRIEIGPRRQG